MSQSTTPLLFVHLGTNNIDKNEAKQIRGDYEVLGRKIKDLGAQGVFSSILTVEGKGPGKDYHMEVKK